MNWKSNGFKTIEEAIKHHASDTPEEIKNPKKLNYRIQNLEKMASWIKFYIKEKYPFTIFGDYDVDGVCATASIYMLLNELGAKNIRLRLPKRFSEGYGMKPSAVEEVNSGILITVDNGIAAHEAIELAKKKGLVVLVIDHHEPVIKNGEICLPKADLIVDPAVPDEKIGPTLTGERFRKYCGAGLVYKLARCLLPEESRTLGKISAFAALATVADVMPLIKDNRLIYREGIRNIRERNITPGLQCLVDALCSNNIVLEGDIGFNIAPKLNAPGRIYDDGAMKSLKALLSEDWQSARLLAEELREDNEKRKTMKDQAIKRAEAYIKDECLYGDNPIVILDPETKEGIIGLVAGYITEKYDVSCFCFTTKGDTLKGSGRACSGNNLKQDLDKLAAARPDIFLGYGGHPGAAGVNIRKDKFEEFRNGMINVMPDANPYKVSIEYDLEIPSGKITEVTEELSSYAPFGEGNPPLIVKIDNFKIVPQNNVFYKEMGQGHLKVVGAGCEAVGFSMMEKYKSQNYPTAMDVIGKLTYHYFNDKKTPQLEMIDFRKRKEETPSSTLSENIMNMLHLNGLG